MYLVAEVVEAGCAALAIAEESYAEPFPKAFRHHEGLADGCVASAVEAVGEAVLVGGDVEGDAQEHLRRPFAADEFRLSVLLYIDAVGIDADAAEVAADTEQSGTGGVEVAAVHQYGGLALEAHGRARAGRGWSAILSAR